MLTIIVLAMLAQDPASSDQWGFDWGVGLMVATDLDEQRVDQVEIIRNRVVVTREESTEFGPWFTAHLARNRWGWWAGMQPDTDGSISRFGTGVCYNTGSKDGTGRWSIGFGPAWAKDITVLAPGFAEGQQVPDWWMEGDPFTKEKPGLGFVISVSHRF